MMSAKNQEIAHEVLISLIAKDKLDQIVAYLDSNEKIEKQTIMGIINNIDETLIT